MNPQTVRERIRNFLEHHPVASIKQVADSITDVTALVNEKDKWRFYNKVSFYLHQLSDEGIVQKVRYGHYSLTEKGLQQLHTKTAQPQLSSSLAAHDIDLENIKIINALIQKYGRTRLLQIVDEIKKNIENK